jgi:hypothetical protein
MDRADNKYNYARLTASILWPMISCLVMIVMNHAWRSIVLAILAAYGTTTVGKEAGPVLISLNRLRTY